MEGKNEITECLALPLVDNHTVILVLDSKIVKQATTMQLDGLTQHIWQ